jgi:hypothetical protein
VANIRRLENLTAWVEYKLTTTLLDPPVLRLRLRYVNPVDMVSTSLLEDPTFRFGKFAADNAIEAVAEWDLTENGVPVPVTAENKVAYLRPILAEPVEGRTLLGFAILQDAQDRKLFLKN